MPTVLLEFRRKKRRKRANDEIRRDWIQSGSPVPPPHFIKQEIIQDYAIKFGCEVFVETGTFKGDMVEAQKQLFKRLISIELDTNLYLAAKERFKLDNKIEIVQGDSGKELSTIVSKLQEKALFWLDGHYSGGETALGEKECPIFEEIDAIFDANQEFKHVILIDDARCFVGVGDYPTVEQLSKYVQNKNSKYKVEIIHDIICYSF